MEASELKINNWYLSTKFNIPVQCAIEDFNELYHRCDGAELDEEIIATMFEPIPLTKELFIKIRYYWDESIQQDKSLVLDISGRRKIVFYDGDPKCLSLYQDGMLIDFPSSIILYLHKLQDLHKSLTGEELIIKF